MLGFETWWAPVAVLAAAVAAGAANAVAGGGSAISFPTLVMVGIPPVAANATNAVGLWPGGMAAAWSYRARLHAMSPRTASLLIPGIAGGFFGAWLLIHLPARSFEALAPYLVLASAASVGVEPLVRRRVGGARIRESTRALLSATPTMLAVATYGGYFGAGMGMLLLTALGLLGLHDIQQANAVKNLLTTAVKLPAVVYFLTLGLPHGATAILMVLGAAGGGWSMGHLIQRVRAERFRWVVVAMGVAFAGFMLAR